METGTYANLLTEVMRIVKKKKKLKPAELEKRFIKLANKYTSRISKEDKQENEEEFLNIDPEIIISESFI